MHYKNKGFTLVELTISMVILAIIIIGIGVSLAKVSNSLSDTTLKANIFSDIKDFSYDSYMFNYNSGKILSGALLLYNTKEGIVVGGFLDENGGFDYKINSNYTIYNKNYFGYFKIQESTLSGILNSSIDPLTLKFNNGKIFKNLLLKDFLITSYNTGTIFETNFSVFKKFNNNYYLQSQTGTFIPAEDYLKFNFNF